MSPLSASFDVVVMALCPQDHVQRFCDYYLGQGAGKVTVFHDGPTDMRNDDCRIDLIVCDDEFWSKLDGGRPFSVEGRQRAIYAKAYSECSAPWLLVVDIDEFVVGPTSLALLFESLIGGGDCVRFTSAEAIYSEADDIHRAFGARMFRRPMERHVSPVLSRLVYGSLGSLFTRGLLGHSRGKQAVRTGEPGMSVDIHDAVIAGRPTVRIDATRTKDFHLAHFDAINFAAWSEKCADRLSKGDAKEMGRKREQQLRLYAGCSSADERESLFRKLYALSPLQETLLDRLGLISRNAPEFAQAIGSPDLGKSTTQSERALFCRPDAYAKTFRLASRGKR